MCSINDCFWRYPPLNVVYVLKICVLCQLCPVVVVELEPVEGGSPDLIALSLSLEKQKKPGTDTIVTSDGSG